MQAGKVLIPLLGALIMAVGAALLAGRLMNDGASGNPVTGEIRPSVVVASSDIHYGQEIRAEHLRLLPVAASEARPGMLTSLEEVSGKVATGDIFQGEPVIRQRIADKTSGSMLASLVGENMRAVSVRVNDVIGVAGFLLPGNRVDVLASRMEGQRSFTRTVLQNIKVLAVDQTVAANQDTPVIVRAVTLEVAPADSQQLFQAIQEGSIHLTLRNPVDAALVAGIPAPAPAEPVAAIPIAAPPAPLPAPEEPGKPDMAAVDEATKGEKPVEEETAEPPPAPTVTIIRGTTIDKVVLPDGGN